MPKIYLTYILILAYYVVFYQNPLILLILLVSVAMMLFRYSKKYLVILFIFLAYFSYINNLSHYKLNKDYTSPKQVSPILDTIEVNGDSLSFKGYDGKNKYQVFYKLQSKEEKNFFEKLDKNVVLSIKGELSKADSARNFNGFDYRDYLSSQEIYRILEIDNIYKVVKKTDSYNIHSFSKLRRKAILYSNKTFPNPMSSYVTGLLFGYLGQDFEEMSVIYSALGVMHLFSLSGMQVNFFITGFRKIFLRLGIRRDFLDYLQIPLSLIYAGLTGFSISIMRSLLQKILANYGFKHLDNFSLTIIIFMLFKPKFLLTASGVLSFAFSFVIYMMASRIQVGILGKVKESCILSLAITPFIIYYFYDFQPASILLTLILSLVFDQFLLGFLLLSFSLSLFLPIKFLKINTCFQYLELVIKGLAKILPTSLNIGRPNIYLLIILLIFIAKFLDNYKSSKKIGLVLVMIISCFVSIKYARPASITMVDVGQGDSIFIQNSFNGKNMLIDLGGRLKITSDESWKQRQSKAGVERTLIPYLKSQGVSKIDTLVISHAHEDHMGDLEELAQNIKIKKIIASQGALSKPLLKNKLVYTKSQVQVAKIGEKLPILDSNLTILAPKGKGDGGNNDSVVLYGKLCGSNFLFTGDMEVESEDKLLSMYPKLPVDILKAGHHGSKTSSGSKFLEATRPKIALISCGLNNRYKHPNQETLDNFNKYKIKIFRTDKMGAIKLMKKGNTWKIITKM